MKIPPKIKGITTESTGRRIPEEELREKEAEYRMLFNDSPVSLWVEDFSEVKKFLGKLRASGIKNLSGYFDEHPEEVIKCVSLVRINDVNKATLIMYQAKNIEELREGLNEVFNKESYDIFKKELIALAEGKTTFETEAVTHTLKGKKNYIKLKWSIAPGCEKSLSKVLVSIVDLTDHRELEERLSKYRQSLEKMVEKRTENLADANKKLREEIAWRKRVQIDLVKSRANSQALLNAPTAIAMLIDSKGIIFNINEMAARCLGKTTKQLLGECVYDLLPPKLAAQRKAKVFSVISSGRYLRFEDERGGRILDNHIYPVCDEKGKVERLAIFGIDITERKRNQEALKESEKRLRAQKKALEEKNIALREIMAQIEIEKRQIEANVIANIDEILLPHLLKLKRRGTSIEKKHIEILNNNLNNLASSFGRKISGRRYRLTPREIEISTMIKNGLTSKNVAELLHISRGTVDRHREKIRKKLNLTHNNINLTSFLQDF